MRLIFIRHGEPDYSTDLLTEKGKLDSQLLAERVVKWNIKDIYVSPQGRAKETAKPSLEKLGREAIELPWIHEFSYKINNPLRGDQGVPWDFPPSQLYEEALFQTQDEWVNGVMLRDVPKIAEDYPYVIGKFDELLEKYGYIRNGKYYLRKDGKERFINSTVTNDNLATADLLPEDDCEPTIVFFCHLGIISLILSHLLNIPFMSMVHGFFLPTTSVTIVNTEERWGSEVSFRVQAMGDTAHLLMKDERVSSAGSFARAFSK